MLLVSIIEQAIVVILIGLFIFVLGVLSAPKAKLKEKQIALVLDKIKSITTVDAEKGKKMYDEFKEWLATEKKDIEPFAVSNELNQIIEVAKKII